MIKSGSHLQKNSLPICKSAYVDLLAYFDAWMTAASSNERAATSPISSKVIALLSK